ncbi:hypothetical protein GALMADRAFT_714501 [Galerina marginata CBS 339.88]|uniref:Ubiquitin-like domain-containing protein n=1 Tax=Galerina marginata (strain CBS 339.88) TaxID=685588 RepID=A0A067TQ97_GALM3|nr:hypothetical protein GALMADRAFT_714501 [Galerina marginata CBS 339.88]
MSVVAFTAGSLGDILATAGLAAQVVKVLYDNKSLSKECDILAIELRSLQSTLIMVEFALQRYGSTPLGEPLAHFAKPEVAQCYLALKVFEERIVACQQALSLTGIASLWRKIVWAVSDETAVLSAKLGHHRVKLVTLLMVLNSVGWMDSGNQSNYLIEGRMYTENRGCSRSLHGVKDHTIEVVDPLGETIPIPILFCVTWEAFDHVLKGYSKGRIGEHYIQQGDYQIIASGIDRVIDRSKLGQVQVGERIEMSIVLRSRKGIRDNLGRCPRCSHLNTVASSEPGRWTRCLQCSDSFPPETLAFRQIKTSQQEML